MTGLGSFREIRFAVNMVLSKSKDGFPMNLSPVPPHRVFVPRYIPHRFIAKTKYMRYVLLGALSAFSLTPSVFAQVAAPAAASQAGAAQFVSVSGTVSAVDAAAKTFTVNTEKGDTVVKYDDRTAFLRMAPGETDMKKASPIQKTDVASGDRVLARIRTGENAATLPATRVIVITKDDLAKRDEKVQEDWATRSTTGIVQSVDASAKQIVIKARGRDITVDASGKVTFRRYNPESVKAADMKMSVLSEIVAGDQLRVLGEKSEDQTKVTAESIVSGAFRTVGVVVKSIDPAGTITGTDAATKKPIVIKVTAESVVKRLEPAMAMMMARQLNPNAATAGRGGGGSPNGGNGARPAGMPGGGALGSGAPGGGAPGGAGGMGPGGPGGANPMRGGGRPDAGKMLESQPTIKLADLKIGDALIVYGLASTDLAKLTALNVIAGAEAILTAAPKGGADPLGGSWNFGEMGGPQ